MIRTLARSTATALMLAACATTPKPDVEVSSQPQPQPAQAAGMGMQQAATTGTAFNPVGNYTFSVDLQGQAINGLMAITRTADGTLGGEMSSDAYSLTFTSVMLEGRKMTATGVLQNGPALTFYLEFTGDVFTGSFSGEGASGTISGTRKKT